MRQLPGASSICGLQACRAGACWRSAPRSAPSPTSPSRRVYFWPAFAIALTGLVWTLDSASASCAQAEMGRASGAWSRSASPIISSACTGSPGRSWSSPSAYLDLHLDAAGRAARRPCACSLAGIGLDRLPLLVRRARASHYLRRRLHVRANGSGPRCLALAACRGICPA